jgi:two-component system, NarL family, sensor histidine kinase UhpB
MAQLPNFRENVSRIRGPACKGREAQDYWGKRVMPLRVRLIALIGSVLLASLACGSVLVAWRAAHSVRTELRAALDVGTKSIRNGLDELVAQDDRARAVRHLVATFNGNRHVRATLLDAQDGPLAVSRLLVPTDPAPGWFRYLIGGKLDPVHVPVPPGGDNGSAIVLQTDPINEIGEVWAESRDAVLVLAGFALLSALLTCAVVGRALRPIEDLSTAFQRIGKGNYCGRVSEDGPPELARLASGFNLMTQQLAAAATQNRRLNERLLTLQAEERAELARDLHDEIGPLLFAADMTAATIERLADSGRVDAIPTQVAAIHDAVGRMQRHVRVILERLRPIRAIGLEVAIGQLAAFWRSRRPDISFIVAISVEEDRIGDDLKETIYRIIQEGVSNAIRHGAPTRVEIAIAHAGDDGVRVEVADDGIGMPVDGMSDRDPAQLGLVGMRERVMAMSGSLSIQRGGNGCGLALVAWLPWVSLLQSQNMADAE